MLAPAVAVDLVATVAALFTTLCWIPQALRIIRTRRTGDISIWTQAAFTFGVAFWLAFGILIASWPVIIANGVTFLLAGTILGLKLRYG